MFEFKLPDLGEGIKEGELLSWHVKEGDIVAEDDPLCDVETDKASVTIPSPRAGRIEKLNGTPGDLIEVGDVLVVIDDGSASEAEPKKGTEPQEKPKTAPLSPVKNKVAAAPATRRLAREMGIDITTISGSGPGGRVTPDDLKNAGEDSPDKSAESVSPEIEEPGPESSVSYDASGIPFFNVPQTPDYSSQGPVETIPMRSLRKKVAVKTTSSMILVPHVAHMDQIDVTDLEKLRKNLNQAADDPSGRITLMAFVMKSCASLLKKHLQFNASVDPFKQEIILKKFVHIGFAADTPKGLVVPVVKDADQKSVSDAAKEIRMLVAKGQADELEVADLTGSTFTITNVGAIGGTGMLPTINYPESAILGMGRVAPQPVVRENEIVIRTLLPVTLCFDHRVADGAQAAKFVTALKHMLEDPGTFLANV